VTIQWDNRDLAEHPIAAANAFMIQGSGHEIVLTIGFAVPPYTPNPPQAGVKHTTITAKTIARVALSPARIVEIINLLQQAQALAVQPK
jgi:hypothetical protein